MLDLDAGTSLADVGCGDGFFTLPAAEGVAPAPVYAIDADGTCLDEIDAWAAERGLGNVTTLSGDPETFASLLPEPVDVVLVVDTFHAVEAPTAFARQVSRSIRPGGRFVVVEWRDRAPEETAVDGGPRGPPNSRRMTPSAVRSAVAPAELVVAREVDLPPHHYALVFRRSHDA